MLLKEAGEFLRKNPEDGDLYGALMKSKVVQYRKPSQMLSSSFRYLGFPGRVRNAVQGNRSNTCAMGLLPLIDSAWVFVDKRLMLWKVGSKEDPIEFWLTTTDMVTCVGVVNPKSGVQLKTLFIMCDEDQVSMSEVSSTSHGASERLNLRMLPRYTCPTGGRIMTTIRGTVNGRVFMGSKCGKLFELYYEKRGGPSTDTSLCSLVDCSPSFWDYLPSKIVNRKSAVKQLVVDDERGFIYVLHEDSLIEVFSLKLDSKKCPEKVATCEDIHSAGRRAPGGAANFGDQESITISSMSVIPCAISKKLHLVCLTTTGCRMYLSVQQEISPDFSQGSVMGFKVYVMFVSPSPINQWENLAYGAKGYQAHHMLITNGLTIYVKSCIHGDTSSEVCLLGPSEGPENQQYQEINYGAIAIGEGSPVALVRPEGCGDGGGQLQWYEDLAGNCLRPKSAQLFEQNPSFLLLTQQGLVEIDVQWPATHLVKALEVGNGSDLEAFASLNGGAEAAAICTHVGSLWKSRNAKGAAMEALISAHRSRKGISVDDVTSGIRLYISRCLGVTWGKPFFKEVEHDDGGIGLQIAWPDDQMQWYHDWCIGTAETIGRVIDAAKESQKIFHRTSRKPHNDSVSSLGNLRSLITRVRDAMSLADILCNWGLSEIPSIEDIGCRAHLLAMTLDDVVSIETTDSPLKHLILDMVLKAGRQNWHGDAQDMLIQQLEERSSSYFGRKDFEFIRAHGMLVDAKNLEEDDELECSVVQAVDRLLTIPQAIVIQPITQALYDCSQYKFIATLCVAVAKARDPDGLAFCNSSDNKTMYAKELRKPCHDTVLNLVGYVLGRSFEMDTWKKVLDDVLMECAGEYDPLLLRRILELLEDQESQECLLKLPLGNIAKFLLEESGLKNMMWETQVTLTPCQQSPAFHLADHYQLRKDYRSSAYLYCRLGGQLSPLDIEDRVDHCNHAVAAAEELDNEEVLTEARGTLEHVSLQLMAYEKQTAEEGQTEPPDSRLQTSIVELPELYLIFSRAQMHDLCLRCLALLPECGGREKLLSEHWDKFLHALIDVKPSTTHGSRTEFICAAIGALGRKLHGGFDKNLGSYVSVHLEHLMFKASKQSDSEEELRNTSKANKDHLFKGLLEACSGSYHRWFQVCCEATSLIVDDPGRDSWLKMELLRTTLRVCWSLQPIYKQLINRAEGRGILEAEAKAKALIHWLDDFISSAKTLTRRGNGEILFDLNSGFQEIKMDLIAALNSRRPLFSRDPGYTFD